MKREVNGLTAAQEFKRRSIAGHNPFDEVYEEK